MLKLLITINFIIFVILFGNMNANNQKDPFLNEREIWESRLMSASKWLIINGLEYYSLHGKKALEDQLHAEFRLGQYMPAYTSKDHDYSAFGITLGGSFFDVSCFYREEKSGEYYELWTVQTSYDPVYEKQNRTLFYYVVARDFYGERWIELESDFFRPEYKFEDGYSFIIPLDNKIVVEKILKVINKY